MQAEGELRQTDSTFAGTSLQDETNFLSSAIGKLREKLIDTSKASPLIAFRHSERGASYVRIIDETLDGLYDCLSSGAPMTFQPLPDSRMEPADQKTPTFRLALERARRIDSVYKDDLKRAGGDPAAADEADAALVARVRDELGLPKLGSSKAPDLVAVAKAHGIVNGGLKLPICGEVKFPRCAEWRRGAELPYSAEARRRVRHAGSAAA